jgi:5-formyltetrahydrofolate cyclo-ligase
VRAAADRSIAGHIRRLPAYRSARRIALFLAFDGEPSLAALVESAARSGKRLYAPVITRSRMRFAELELGGPLGTNFFGIQEPHLGEIVDPRRLDLVLTPLVAFDDRGVRIGVGRGYYDRCFRFLRARVGWKRPKLLAVAYELQHVPSIEENEWDVPLWGAVTETGVRRFDQASSPQGARR